MFEALPGTQVLTLNMDVPEAWLVEAVQAEVRLSVSVHIIILTMCITIQ